MEHYWAVSENKIEETIAYLRYQGFRFYLPPRWGRDLDKKPIKCSITHTQTGKPDEFHQS